MKGKHLSEEWKKLLSEHHRTKRGFNSPMKGKHHLAVSNEKNRLAHTNPSEEIREKIREARAKQIFPIKDSGPEIKIQNFLNQLDIVFIPHRNMNEIKHKYQSDMFIPSVNLVIECDGNYWHNYPKGKEIDRIRTQELVDKGFKVLRLWESDIKRMMLESFWEKLKPFQKELN